MSTNVSKSPDWTDLLKKPTQNQKKKKAYVTPEQRQELLNFILENPEMVTHSSTKENENSLWNELTKKLNALLPEKSVGSWQNFWKRWRNNVEMKHESALTVVDYKLKRFLKNISADYEHVQAIITQNSKQTTSLEEVCNSIKDVEEEKTKIKLEIDQMEYYCAVYQTQIAEFKKAIAQKRKQCMSLSIKKSNLNSKRRKIEEKENASKQ